jgi:hypothetical protein
MNQAMMRRKITKQKLERILSILVAIIAVGNAVHAIVVMGMIRDGRSGLGNPQYEAQINAVTVMNFIISLVFLVYGSLMFHAARTTAVGLPRRRKIEKILIISLVYSLSFLSRSTMLLFRPITGLFFPNTFFWTFAMYIPDFVPTAIQLYFIYARTREENYHRQIQQSAAMTQLRDPLLRQGTSRSTSAYHSSVSNYN